MCVISGKVLEQQDLGTHTLFIAEVTDAKLLNENARLLTPIIRIA